MLRPQSVVRSNVTICDKLRNDTRRPITGTHKIRKKLQRRQSMTDSVKELVIPFGFLNYSFVELAVEYRWQQI